MAGFLKLQRRFFDHWLWKDEARQYSKAEAFLDMLQMAAYGPITRMVSGCPVDLLPGQLIASERFLSTRWGWSTTKVRTFIQTLVGQAMIASEKKQPASVITLLNYERYAAEESTKKALKKQGESGEKAGRKQMIRSKEGEEGEDKEYDAVFDLWNLLPLPSKIQERSAKRIKLTTTRLKDPFFRLNWEQAMRSIPDSPFLLGSGKDGWRASIDWFLQPDSVSKIQEGKYLSAKTSGGRHAGFEENIEF